MELAKFTCAFHGLALSLTQDQMWGLQRVQYLEEDYLKRDFQACSGNLS